MKQKTLLAASLLVCALHAEAGFIYLDNDKAKDGGSGEVAGRGAEGRPIEFGQGRNVLQLVPGKGRISAALRDYAKANGWELAWEMERDFPIDYPATFSGTFLEVMEQVAKSLQNTDTPIRIKVYEANKVIRVIHATR
ncbi:hypothetical protein BI347_15840 [Chromobacterium sphagni]|uniref:Toxin co-regulated pilus biosynthesis protein Q C-terminal domain-containing protein n=1 Tax=Chromobacterium sphagni TaxID=1903179 RepID=A0A1S1X5P8_9NEIS|nr:toxin co-regulated pilus biosynthesis Q family protein [Chromobacterium sphagni]OHX14814.1 hypothetical protein BI347_15840 [Chromobacterium sphagni]